MLKVLDFSKAFKLIRQGQIWDMAFVQQILPILAYLILGLIIAIVISKAYKLLAMSIVYAAWMGLTLLLQIIVDVFLYHIPMQVIQFLFIACVLAGILGIKLSNPNSNKN